MSSGTRNWVVGAADPATEEPHDVGDFASKSLRVKPISVLDGMGIPQYDYVSLAQDATHDTWTFKTGGAGGTTVGTVTVTFTDATKVTIASVAKT